MLYIPLQEIGSLAIEQGFVKFGATKLDKVENFGKYLNYLSKGYNANMQYLSNYLSIRQDPRLLLENSKTIFSFLYSYNDEDICSNSRYKIALYAQREDYHFVLKDKLNQIIALLITKYPKLECRAFVDSVPLLEKYWAEKSGLGWIGKNGLLINKDFGNKTFICEIISNCTTDYTYQTKNYCGNCHKCIDICPNNAIKDRGIIDSNSCISYQTIENKSEINNINCQSYVYGCDLCLNICMWNNKAKPNTIDSDNNTKDLISKFLLNIENQDLTKQNFTSLKKHSPINRIKLNKLLDNIRYCQNNNLTDNNN